MRRINLIGASNFFMPSHTIGQTCVAEGGNENHGRNNNRRSEVRTAYVDRRKHVSLACITTKTSYEGPSGWCPYQSRSLADAFRGHKAWIYGTFCGDTVPLVTNKVRRSSSAVSVTKKGWCRLPVVLSSLTTSNIHLA